jgi:hypothetical protein
MSITDRLLGSTDSDDESESSSDSDQDQTEEQLARTPGSELEPKGERRQSDSGGFFTSYVGSLLDGSRTSTTGIGTDVSVAPEQLTDRYETYVKTKPLVKAPLSIFSDAVVEPGWTVSAEIDGETDEDMEEALELWGENCAIHSHEAGKDIITLVEQIPEKRRGKGTMFLEKVGTRGDADSLGGVMLLDPSTIKIYSRENQPILIQPDDDVDPDHPTTEDGRAAAFTQYEDDDLYPDTDPIAFAADDLVKIVHDPDEGDAWGTPLWVAIQEHIDGLYQKLRDRNASIRINGHPWRIISNENWSYEQASRFLRKHFEGDDISTWADAKSEKEKSFAGRLDAVPHEIDVQEHTGDVPDIEDAIMDDIQAIFSVQPVSRFKIAYESDINQFVVEPQDDKDERNVIRERNRIREAIEPIFKEKADELAGGEYEGEVTWKLEQPTDENPLERESFDSDDFSDVARPFIDAGAPQEVVYWLAGVDPEEFDYTAEVGGLDEADEDVQEAARAMGIGEGEELDEDEAEDEELE